MDVNEAGSMAKRVDTSFDELEAMAQDFDPEVRKALCFRAGHLMSSLGFQAGHEAQKAWFQTQAFKGLCRDPDPEVRKTLAENIRENSSAIAACQVLAQDPDPEVRREVARNHVWLFPSTHPGLQAMLRQDPDPAVRQAYAWASNNSEDLDLMASDQDEEVRELAVLNPFSNKAKAIAESERAGPLSWIQLQNKAFSKTRNDADMGVIQGRVDAYIKSRE